MNNKVLIIEDSPLTVRILSDMLRVDYEVLTAFSGSDGLEIAFRENPDIIILDVVMNGMNGYEVCKRLKQNNLTQNIPVIFISSLDEMDDERKGLEAGAIDYITKPFSEPIVKIRIKNHLELKWNRDILYELSSLDGLTSVYNRRYFDNKIDQVWKESIINNKHLSFILIDIDKFKLYNDNFGHLEGDECLKLVAANIKNCVTEDNFIISRFNGDTFACILPETDIDAALPTANRIQKRIHDLKIPFSASTTSEVLTVSIALTTIKPNKNVILTNFLKTTDDLLLKAKKNGRNQVLFLKIE
jgi:diguanylate cyclase (GGDEF)-like protein